VERHDAEPDEFMTFAYTSDAAHAVFGLAPVSERQASDISALIDLILAEDRRAFVDALDESRLTLTPLHEECRIIGPDGAVEWIEVRAVPEIGRGGDAVWHGFAAVVTGRKSVELDLRRSKDLWEMAAIATGLGIVQFDNDATSLTLDHRASLMHLLPSAPTSRLGVDEWLALLRPEDRAPVSSDLRRACDSQEPLVIRYRLHATSAILELSAHRVAHAHSRLVEIVGTCRDVTGQVSAELLRRNKEAAERASRAKSEFLSRVSHELRTPLNGILGFAQLMALDAKNALNGVQLSRLKTLQMAGNQLLALIDDMLEIARIEREDFALECGPLDAAVLAQACVTVVHPLATELGVFLPDVQRQPCPAMANVRALEQVLTNLLSNAIKYNRTGGRVTLTMRSQPGLLLIDVGDEGRGMTKEQQVRLFQPFDRLGAERSGIPGSGLGLVIARELMRAMGGDLSVQSAPKVGTTFTVALPTPSSVEKSPSRVCGRLGASPSPSGEEAVAAMRHVLYIEDEAVNVLLMEEVFRLRPNWRLTVAGKGAEGVGCAVKERPDLVLVDMNLPDMSGLQVIEQLRACDATRHLPCIALSADALCEQIDAALRAGFDEYWTKPIDITRVLEDLANALTDRHLSRPTA